MHGAKAPRILKLAALYFPKPKNEVRTQSRYLYPTGFKPVPISNFPKTLIVKGLMQLFVVLRMSGLSTVLPMQKAEKSVRHHYGALWRAGLEL
jgi:hypothetical protein